MRLSDDVVEAVARAMFDAACSLAGAPVGVLVYESKWAECSVDDAKAQFMEVCRHAARAARAAISTLTSLGWGNVAEAEARGREQAAKVAENFPAHTHGALATAPAYAAEQAADEIAAAIRAMNSKKPAAG